MSPDAQKRQRPASDNKGEYFENLGAVRGILTENRLLLLRLIRKHQPDSVPELARLARRDFKHVHGDAALLQDLGLVRATANKQGSRRG